MFFLLLWKGRIKNLSLHSLNVREHVFSSLQFYFKYYKSYVYADTNSWNKGLMRIKILSVIKKFKGL